MSIACRASINEDVELLHHVGVGEVRRFVGGDHVAIPHELDFRVGIGLVVDAEIVEVLRAKTKAQLRLTAGRVDDAAVAHVDRAGEFIVSNHALPLVDSMPP